MAIYDKPTKALMSEWASANLQPGLIFTKALPVAWFRANYPKIKSNTVDMHVEGMAVNNQNRRHHPQIKPGSGHDLFFKLGPNQFRLWDKDHDPDPRYKADIEASSIQSLADAELSSESSETGEIGGDTFAYEKDLQNYLARNLHHLEPGLRL